MKNVDPKYKKVDDTLFTKLLKLQLRTINNIKQYRVHVIVIKVQLDFTKCSRNPGCNHISNELFIVYNHKFRKIVFKEDIFYPFIRPKNGEQVKDELS